MEIKEKRIININKNSETLLENSKFSEKSELINNFAPLIKQQNPFKI